jgi:hypothetical protein
MLTVSIRKKSKSARERGDDEKHKTKQNNEKRDVNDSFTF